MMLASTPSTSRRRVCSARVTPFSVVTQHCSPFWLNMLIVLGKSDERPSSQNPLRLRRGLPPPPPAPLSVFPNLRKLPINRKHRSDQVTFVRIVAVCGALLTLFPRWVSSLQYSRKIVVPSYRPVTQKLEDVQAHMSKFPRS